jgi:hypothetical protein
MLKGKSRARAQGKFLQPPETPEIPPVVLEQEVEETAKLAKRHASVYDAVAGVPFILTALFCRLILLGRVGLNGFITKHAGAFASDLPSANIKPLAPQEVLLRRVRAPTQAPLGYYAADEELPADQRLPDSDLLKAIHAYASDFYSMATHDKGRCDFRSMDETALLALSVLLEEAAVEVLGETGDMVLVEPEGLENIVPEERITRHQIKGRVRPIATPELEAEIEQISGPDIEEAEGRRRKRRRYNVFR